MIMTVAVTTETETRDDGRVITFTYHDGVLAQRVVTDPENAHNWTSITRNFNALGDMIEQVIVFDDGRTKTETFEGGQRRSLIQTDDDNSRPWSQLESRFDAAGELTFKRTDYDDGDALQLSYVDGNLVSRLQVFGDEATTYSSREKTFDENGLLTSEVFNNRDGRIDTSNYDADGNRTSRTIEDTGNIRNWDMLEFTYNQAGEKTGEVMVMDDGREKTSTFENGIITGRTILDLDDAFGWSRIEQSFDGQGDLISETRTRDDGSVRETDFNRSPSARDDVLGSQSEPVSEFLVNESTNGSQDRPSITTLADGRFVVAWSSEDGGEDTSDAGVKAQIFEASGITVGVEFLVNTHTINHQQLPEITALSDGGFVITWTSFDQDGDQNDGIRAQIYNADGSARGGEFHVNTQTVDKQHGSDTAALTNGGFVITWEDYAGDTSGAGIKAQIFNANGVPQGGEFLVNTQENGHQFQPTISGLANSGFVITWRSQDGVEDISGWGVKAQIFDASGSTVGGEFLVNTYTPSTQNRNQIATLKDGGFVITWNSYGQDGDQFDGVRAQIYNADGSLRGDEFHVNTQTVDDQIEPEIAALTDGGFVITWADEDGDTSGTSLGIKAQIFDANGLAQGGEFLVNEFTNGGQNRSSVTALDDGGFVVTWSSPDGQQGDTSSTGIKVRIFNADGTPRNISGPATDEDTALTIDDDTLLANDTDADGDTLTINDVDATSANGAAVSINVDGDVVYDPTGAAAIQALSDDETLEDSFVYTVSDGNGGTDTATVTVVVGGLDEPAGPEAAQAPVKAELEPAPEPLDLYTGPIDEDQGIF